MHLIFSQSMTEGRIAVVHVVLLLSTTPNVYYSRAVRIRLVGWERGGKGKREGWRDGKGRRWRKGEENS